MCGGWQRCSSRVAFTQGADEHGALGLSCFGPRCFCRHQRPFPCSGDPCVRADGARAGAPWERAGRWRPPCGEVISQKSDRLAARPLVPPAREARWCGGAFLRFQNQSRDKTKYNKQKKGKCLIKISNMFWMNTFGSNLCTNLCTRKKKASSHHWTDRKISWCYRDVLPPDW